MSERASLETNPEELRESEASGFQDRNEPDEDSIALDHCASRKTPRATASGFNPWATPFPDEVTRYLHSLSFKNVTMEGKPDSKEMSHQPVAKEENQEDDSEEDPIIARIPKAYRVPPSRTRTDHTRQYVVPEQADESRPPPILPDVLRTMRLLEADYALFRELEVRGSKNCPEHCPPKGKEAFCFCIQAYNSSDLEDHILTKLDFVME